MSATQIVIEPPLDRDANSFFQRANVTDPSAKRDITRFVREMKRIGIWDSSICWPLRDSQNAGAGSTVYSLGGISKIKGTLVNGAAWGVNGIVNTDTSQKITLDYSADILSIRSAFVVFLTSDAKDNIVLLDIQNYDQSSWYSLFRYHGASPTYPGAQVSMTRSGAGSFNAASNPKNFGEYQSAAFTMDASSDSVIVNGTLCNKRTGLSDVNPANTPNERVIFGSSNALVGSFALVSVSTWTAEQVQEMHSIYASTLGKGLGLS